MNKTGFSDEAAIFVRVVERGGFAAAAEGTGLTPSGVSRSVTRLEDRLGVRLLQRTTRRLALTPEGETMLARGRAILAAIEAAEAEVTAARGRPRGLLRVNTGTAFARHRLVPRLAEFRVRYPEVTLELSVNDRRVDLMAEQIDIAIRTGRVDDSSLIARTLETDHRVICASPAYLARRGTPVTPEDLARHDCLVLHGFSRLAEWPFLQGGRVAQRSITPAMTCDSVEVLRDMTLAGLGIVRLAGFLLRDALEEGRLVPLLAAHHVPEPVPITALMPPGRQHLPRVRALLDLLTEGRPTPPGAANAPGG
ncbi:LysR family transcriptional regulator [Falsiroseomonas sp.]|uniref:LysR family transcriptional regulator n=1 Tax=Falsiroseomonas sp. TaxID=2870721 RepID=UPI0027373FB6|nr:LysR family transcriptional regulator [Falsiroseomonas sp.]MDP3415939.1 LysR family transcriptional regulator [Falsiroseomonas sp.]